MILPTKFNFYTVAECGCGEPMFPNISTGDEEGYGWICTVIDCGDYTAPELEPEDLIAVGVPEWVANNLVSLIESLTEV
jgi:hypothetical protein